MNNAGDWKCLSPLPPTALNWQTVAPTLHRFLVNRVRTRNGLIWKAAESYVMCSLAPARGAPIAHRRTVTETPGQNTGNPGAAIQSRVSSDAHRPQRNGLKREKWGITSAANCASAGCFITRMQEPLKDGLLRAVFGESRYTLAVWRIMSPFQHADILDDDEVNTVGELA